MDALDILGGLLGKKRKSTGGGGLGGKILKDLIGRRSAPAPQQRQPQPAPQPRRPRVAPRDEPPRGGGFSLDDLIAQAEGRYTRRTAPPAEQPQLPAEAPLPPAQESAANAQATLLIRSMVAAAKADGQIDRSEQADIVKHFGERLSEEQVSFLRAEFAREESVRDFCWSVPLGMEEHVYAAAVMSIDLDQNREAQYLKDLAHGLRLDPEECNAIHDQFQAPRIFR